MFEPTLAPERVPDQSARATDTESKPRAPGKRAHVFGQSVVVKWPENDAKTVFENVVNETATAKSRGDCCQRGNEFPVPRRF
jgi:hypothetical protein